MKSQPNAAGQSVLASQGNAERDDSRAAGFLLAHQQLGALALGTLPSNGQVIPIVMNGTTITITAVSTIGSTPNNILIPGTPAAFTANVANFLRRPDVTNANQVAATVANQQLLQYVGWTYLTGGTTIIPFSLNKNVNGITGALTSFNITGITVTSASWTAQTMQLYVESGTYYINGTRYLFNGGSTPTVTGPVSNPRIDVLSIDTSGTLAWTTGTENASPVAPTYPSNKLAICELYNVVSETALYDNENQQTGQGYIYNDVRPAMSYGPVFSAIAEDLAPDATDTRNIGESSGNEWNGIYGKNIYASTGLFLGGNPVASAKFGGTGADGALSITSGTTTINLANAAVVIKNYTSISITGTGALAFSNPNTHGTIVILKSQGAVTITTSATAAISTVGLGGQSVASQVAGNYSTSNFIITPQGGGGATGSTYGAGGVFLASGMLSDTGLTFIGSKFVPLICGASGGGSFAATSGAGAGALYIECAGALNFTGTINASGSVGTANGGGGGGGGTVVILYNTLTANTGTITTTGGSGASAGGQFTGGGGAAIGGNGVTGNGTNGGAGANGFSMVAQNTEFA